MLDSFFSSSSQICAIELLLAVVLLFLSFLHGVSPVKVCGTADRAAKDLIHYEKDLKKYVLKNEELVGNSSSRRRAAEDLGVQLRIPLIFHVIYNSSAGTGRVTLQTLKDQVQVLNKAYWDTVGLSFYLFKVNYVLDPTYFKSCHDLAAEIQTKYVEDPTQYINVFTCSGQGFLGWANLPGNDETAPSNSAFITWKSLPSTKKGTYTSGDTLVHELGHYFGLYHTFQGGCSQGNDYVSDTPQQKSASFKCKLDRDTCTKDTGFDDVSNYMDYSPDACMNHFTPGQILRMQSSLQKDRPVFMAKTAILPIPPSSISTATSSSSSQSPSTTKGGSTTTTTSTPNAEEGPGGDATVIASTPSRQRVTPSVPTTPLKSSPSHF